MNEQYSIEEKIHEKRRKGVYVPVSMKIYKEGESKFDAHAYPWEKLWIDRKLNRGTPIFIVSFIQHSGVDSDAKAFISESIARKYLRSLAIVLSQKQGDTVDLHYKGGKSTVYEVLNDIPLDTYVNFRTPNDEFSVTLAKTIY